MMLLSASGFCWASELSLLEKIFEEIQITQRLKEMKFLGFLCKYGVLLHYGPNYNQTLHPNLL